MPEQLYKLTPDRDLQCYFLTPSAIAAMSNSSSTGFTLSGKWRQQFDWAVVEWNRDNVFEHPALRNLPDGDLSGLVLTYEESRTGCIPIESNLYPVVAWDQLRLWVPNADGTETVYYVNISDHAQRIAGVPTAASATMTLVASPGTSRAGLAFLEEHFYYAPAPSDSLSDIAAGIAANIRLFSPSFTASSDGPSVTVIWNATTQGAPYGNLLGANGNRISVYGFAQDGKQIWAQPSVAFSGGSFPASYLITLDFGNLKGKTDLNPDPTQTIATTNVRKVRWTYAADLQPASFQQAEFAVSVSSWSVTGTNRLYSVAGPGSRRIEDTDLSVVYSGSWSVETGNYSGSKVHIADQPNSSCAISYSETAPHEVFLGLRRFDGAADAAVTVDGSSQTQTITLALAGEDVLIRAPLGTFGPGSHSVTLTHAGSSGETLYFDFLEIVYPSPNLPDFDPQPQLSLATDWDTYHAQSLPAERTAWLIGKLGFHGRVNHYTGALWFYEIVRSGTQYASLTVTLNLLPNSPSPTVQFDLAASPQDPATVISHLVLPDDTSATVAQALAGLINIGTNLVWASAAGNQLTVTGRNMGILGNGIFFNLASTSPYFTVTAAGNVLSGGIDGTPYNLDDSTYNNLYTDHALYWRTDLAATPRINRAARDWHLAYFAAIKAYGMDAVAAFSTELANGDPALLTGIAQRYPDGSPATLNTPAIQTNFSPASLTYWKQVYLDMAGLQSAAGLIPYLQSGEVQWWYFPKAAVGMPFYDEYTQQQFTAKYGIPMQTIETNSVDPAAYPNEVAFLPTLIGAYTAAIRSALQVQFPGARYEILYPTDTNASAFNSLINFPETDWTAQNLTCLKTESFGFTGSYDLVNSTASMTLSEVKGFGSAQRSHLVGVGDAWTAWMKEVDIAQSQGLESVVLFALDQYCLIGYPPAPFFRLSTTRRQG